MKSISAKKENGKPLMEIKELWTFQCLENIGQFQFIEGEGTYDPILGWFHIQILFDYYIGNRAFNSGIAFGLNQAYRYTSNSFYKNSNDYSGTLIEYIDSVWLQELYKRNAEIAESCKIRHLAFHFRGCGTYEIIAKRFKILEPKPGLLGL